MTIRVKPSKYRAKPIVIDGILFHSQKEGRRYQVLKLLEKAGEIEDLELQPKFPLYVPPTSGTVRGFLNARMREAQTGSTNIRIGEYRGDFAYYDPKGGRVVEDVKGFKTPLYRWKKRHVEAQYGIIIREV